LCILSMFWCSEVQFLFDILVPSRSVSIVLNTQTVGQSLTLQCSHTTVRGITSRVDIVWHSNGTVLKRMNSTTAITMDNSLVYTDSYTIPQLSTTDNGRMIQCEVVINSSPPVMTNNSITLNVTGMYMILFNCLCDVMLLYTQFLLLESPYHQVVPFHQVFPFHQVVLFHIKEWVIPWLSIVQWEQLVEWSPVQ